MRERALAQFFHRELRNHLTNEALDDRGKAEACRHLLLRLFEEATRPERLHFTTLYARVAYTGHKYGFSPRLLYHLHRFRFFDRPNGPVLPDADWLSLGCKVILRAVERIYGESAPPDLSHHAGQAWPWLPDDREGGAFYEQLRVVAVGDDAEAQQLLVREEGHPTDVRRVQYGLPERNETFNPTIDLIRRITGFPVVLNLLEVEADAAGVLSPRAFIVEPDYLIDVTAVAESFHGTQTLPWGYLASKLLPYELSGSLLRGQIANHFLDALIHNPEATYQELQQALFGLHPLGFCSLSDQELRKIFGELQRHFLTLKQTTQVELAAQGIEREACFVEPSFYSPAYGLQGRLDLLHRPAAGADPATARTSIVELKSGSIFQPNKYGVSAGHFVQTLMYDLLIRGAFGRRGNVAGYILYSGAQERPLRYAPRERYQQYEALQVRNQLLAIDYLVSQLGRGSGTLTEQTDRLFGRLRPSAYHWLSGFTRRNLERIERTYFQLDGTERAYLGAFLGFTAREHRLAKTGEQGADYINGLASLWLDDAREKDERFERLGCLEYLGPAESGDDILLFGRTERTQQLVKFRVGDIAVLYPADETEQEGAVLRNQVFKCTIIALNDKTVSLRLRSRQSNDHFFRQFPRWTVERDLLDSGFIGYYRSLFAWAECTPPVRRLWLGLRPPGQAVPQPLPAETAAGLTPEQYQILCRAVTAPDYFLLWGPPGTGKTSVMLHHLVAYLLRHTDENVLLLAYTNRAVDEICESIERIGGGFQKYLRIGSRYGTAPHFEERLLQVRTEALHTRKELRTLLDENRVFVGTVSSLSGRPELFKLKRFDRIIIDEASQILEPMLLGLLPRAPRVLLIGDHRQLPAVVAQRADESQVEEPRLREIGLTNLAGSLFERLFRRCQTHDWHWAYAMLTHQGRMHHDIMTFPSRLFYDGQLDILPEGVAHRLRQTAVLSLRCEGLDPTLRLLSEQRLVFLPTPTDRGSTDYKTNRHEAALIVRLVQHFEMLYRLNGEELTGNDIGIITPYRAQIACIRQALFESGLHPDLYTVDTVERYQGGARRIILLSLCTNAHLQMETLSSLSEEGVDRKLNVAMTRAQDHLVLLGNPELLRASRVYLQLLEHCQARGGWLEAHHMAEL